MGKIPVLQVIAEPVSVMRREGEADEGAALPCAAPGIPLSLGYRRPWDTAASGIPLLLPLPLPFKKTEALPPPLPYLPRGRC